MTFSCAPNSAFNKVVILISYSSLAQSVERMTVNHDVVGSSPTGGAKEKRVTVWSLAFLSLLRCT